jgi:hypothetical protein
MESSVATQEGHIVDGVVQGILIFEDLNEFMWKLVVGKSSNRR